MTHYDGMEWHSYFPQPDGKILDLKFVDYVSGMYLATAPVKSSDIEVPLLTFLFQRLPTTVTFNAFDPLYNDLENALAVLHKQFLLFKYFESGGDGSHAEIVSTELEYALFNHRSAYDLINRFAVAFLDGHQFKKNEIPDSFRKVAQKSAEVRQAYGFSSALSDFYESKKGKFLIFREVRDAIAHRGQSIGLVFKMPNGFGIGGQSIVGRKLKEGNLWPSLKPVTNDVGSCLALLTLLADDLFTSVSDFTEALLRSFASLPPETAPGYKIYARSRLFEHRERLKEYLNNPWQMQSSATPPTGTA